MDISLPMEADPLVASSPAFDLEDGSFCPEKGLHCEI